jgi:hypothetical protein
VSVGTSNRRSATCHTIVVDLIARQLATLPPEVRAAVCVEALRQALKRPPNPPTGGER